MIIDCMAACPRICMHKVCLGGCLSVFRVSHSSLGVQVKMVTADDDSVTDILVEGPEEEVMRLRKEFNLMEKGKELVKGLLEQ